MRNAKSPLSSPKALLAALLCLGCVQTWAAPDPTPGVSRVLFENVRIFDGTTNRLSPPASVLVEGNVITTIATAPITVPAEPVTRINGAGHTLMPGLIDAHVHLMFESLPQVALLTSDPGFVALAGGKAANEALLRGFTSVRDLGGPSFGLKRAIDTGLVAGPRIWPSGAAISQTGGHGDFRLPTDLPAREGDMSYAERTGASMVADGVDAVRKRVREQLALGASQIKVMAGGGVASLYDPLDVTQYSLDEMQAAVEAARNWGTYVTVHAYTPQAIRMAIQAGAKCIEHGQLADEPTVRLMAEQGVWWSLQPFLDDEDRNPYPEGSAGRTKQLQVSDGTDNAFRLARKYKIRTAWGTDTLFDPKGGARRGAKLSKLTRWYTPFEVLKIATADNGELLALSGARSPYPGKVGVVATGALADLLLVQGNPLADIRLVEDPDRNFLLIMKDGRIYKNVLP